MHRFLLPFLAFDCSLQNMHCGTYQATQKLPRLRHANQQDQTILEHETGQGPTKHGVQAGTRIVHG